MKLILDTHPYRLEQGDESRHGATVFDTMAKVISAFQEQQTDVLFAYTNWDKDKDPHKDELIDSAVQDFHAGLINDRLINQQVKEILLHHYAPERDPKVSQAVMDQLLAYFRVVPLDELNVDLLRKIGSAVFETQGNYTLEDQDAAVQNFINSRLVDTNSIWLLPYDRPVYLKNILWYRVNSQEEILQSFELTDWWFTCAIVDHNKQVEDYRYFLNYTEDYGATDHDEHDGRVLYISAPDQQHFKDTVIPRLKELFGESLEIVV